MVEKTNQSFLTCKVRALGVTIKERVRMAQQQNDTVRHFASEDLFGTATKCLSFFFLVLNLVI